MPLTIALAQYPTQPTASASLSLISKLAHESSADVLLLPEAFLGGYPRGTTFGVSMGSRTVQGRDEFHAYWSSSVDLSPSSATVQELVRIAHETRTFLAVGCIEKTAAAATLFCSVLFVDPVRGVVGKRRKLQPTAMERIVWGQGTADTLRAVPGPQGTTVGAAICWENYMPLLRYALYSQGVNLYLAPTADGREEWVEATMRHVALEGRCFVVSCNQVDVERRCRGGSVIYGPLGERLAGPLWDQEGVLKVTVEDVEAECVKARLDFEGGQGGHYSRSDIFKLQVEGLDLSPE